MAIPSVKIAVVTGANKGIGFSITKKLAENQNMVVILTARDESNGKDAVKKLGKDNVVFHQLDITNDKSVETLAQYIK